MALAAGMFLVDAIGRIVHANASGHSMVAETKVLRAAAGKLGATDPQADQALQVGYWTFKLCLIASNWSASRSASVIGRSNAFAILSVFALFERAGDGGFFFCGTCSRASAVVDATKISRSAASQC
jgi:hypothetical protein